jgi:protein TonB
MMKYILILLIFLSATAKAQIYTYVGKAPEFPGGQEALARYIHKSITYTKEDGAPKTKNLRFVIDSIGNVRNPIIENIDSLHYTAYDKRLIMMIRNMPKWIPGEHEKKKVSVSFVLPIRLTPQE